MAVRQSVARLKTMHSGYMAFLVNYHKMCLLFVYRVTFRELIQMIYRRVQENNVFLFGNQPM